MHSMHMDVAKHCSVEENSYFNFQVVLQYRRILPVHALLKFLLCVQQVLSLIIPE